MSGKWTPGPWECLRSLSRHDGEYDFAISASGVPVLGEAFGVGSGGYVLPAKANAHLIAAAPDLYAELDMHVLNCPVCKGEGYAVDVLDILTRDAPEKTACNRCKSARAALSKARGE